MSKTQSPRKPSRSKQFAQVEWISIAGLGSRVGPSGLWMYADAYVKAAASLPASKAPFEPVRYYLSCHSIELSLKAYLSIRGATMLELSESSYGHNLETILTAAEGKGLLSQVSVSEEHLAEIRKAAVYYGGKVFEYPAVGEAYRCYPSLPTLGVLIEAATPC